MTSSPPPGARNSLADDPFMQRLSGIRLLAHDMAASSIQGERSPEKLLSVVRRLERIADKEVSAIEAQVAVLAEQGHSQPVACRMGCWHCCTQQVAATIPEILFIADHIEREWDPAAKEALVARIGAYMASTEAYRTGASDLKPRHICPLLIEQACSVWAVRPLICRGWNSTDVEACIAKKEQPAEDPMVPMIVGQFYATISVRGGLVEALRKLGIESALCELIPGLAIAMREPDIVERFLVGENPFAGAIAESRVESHSMHE